MAETDKYIQEAFGELEKLSADERKRLEYEAREKAMRDYNCLMDSAQEMGLQQGLKQGSESKLKEITGRMLTRGMSAYEIADMIGEDPDTIQRLADMIQNTGENPV